MVVTWRPFSSPNFLMLALSDDPAFAGLLAALDLDGNEKPSAADIVDDFEAEQEALAAHGDDQDCDATESKEDDGLTQLQNIVRDASKGVTEGTDSEYKRYGIFFLDFCLVSYLVVLESNGQVHGISGQTKAC